jgi:hypothetical protein
VIFNILIWTIITHFISFDLVFRVKDCISAGQGDKIDPSIDGGKWYKSKQQASQPIQSSSQSHPPVLPISGWKKFPSKTIPESFNHGHIHHHIIESVQHVTEWQVKQDGVPRKDSDSSSEEDDSLDLHTAKPLRKGKLFFTSGHVKSIQDHCSDRFYFLKCKVQASYKTDVFYDVTCTLSKTTGFIKDSSCTCKASAMGRCNHVCALLYALLDYSDKYGSDPEACTSKKCTWNVGRKRKNNPQPVHTASYSSYKRRKIDDAYNFDPQPPSLRKAPSQECMNEYIKNLQRDAVLNHEGEFSMAASVLQIQYSEYSLSSVEKQFLDIKCQQLLHNLQVGGSVPIQICKEQGSDEWRLNRRLRITASVCHRIAHLKSESAVSNYIYGHLWETKIVTTKGMTHGIESEPLARAQYFREAQAIYANYNVIETGLWVCAQDPELACSPDGLVYDPSLKDHQLGVYGLLEIKCPLILHDKNIKDFNEILTTKQKQSFCLKKTCEGITLKRSHSFFYQVQMQLGVTGLKWCDFVVWTNKGYIVERVHFDPTFWAPVKAQLVKFHHQTLCPEVFEMKTPRRLSHIIT